MNDAVENVKDVTNIKNVVYTLKVERKDKADYNPLHEEIDGHECVILEMHEGDMGWISYKIEGWAGNRWHTFHTSLINSISENDEKIVIDTMNSVYTLWKCG